MFTDVHHQCHQKKKVSSLSFCPRLHRQDMGFVDRCLFHKSMYSRVKIRCHWHRIKNTCMHAHTCMKKKHVKNTCMHAHMYEKKAYMCFLRAFPSLEELLSTSVEHISDFCSPNSSSDTQEVIDYHKKHSFSKTNLLLPW